MGSTGGANAQVNALLLICLSTSHSVNDHVFRAKECKHEKEIRGKRLTSSNKAGRYEGYAAQRKGGQCRPRSCLHRAHQCASSHWQYQAQKRPGARPCPLAT